MKEDNKFKCQQTDIPENCPGIELNAQSLEMVETFCYLCDTIGARRGAFDSAKTKIKSGWCGFRDLVPLLSKRGLISQESKR